MQGPMYLASNLTPQVTATKNNYYPSYCILSNSITMASYFASIEQKRFFLWMAGQSPTISSVFCSLVKNREIDELRMQPRFIIIGAMKSTIAYARENAFRDFGKYESANLSMKPIDAPTATTNDFIKSLDHSQNNLALIIEDNLNRDTDGNASQRSTASVYSRCSSETIRNDVVHSNHRAMPPIYYLNSALVEHFIGLGYSLRDTQVLLSDRNMNKRVNAHHPAFKGVLFGWDGELPPRNYSNPTFSCKVFIGGVPCHITEAALIKAFSVFGRCKIEFPRKDRVEDIASCYKSAILGYIYIIFDIEISVKKLLKSCSKDFGAAGELFFELNHYRGSTFVSRQVQVIPWVTTDAIYSNCSSIAQDLKRTVFVGALHGMITAQVLTSIMKDVYGSEIASAVIDTDRYQYPIGSARVTFVTEDAYSRAIQSGFLRIRTSKFTKRIQIEPLLVDHICTECEKIRGPYFCRESICFRYFCSHCWKVQHSKSSMYSAHRPMMRNSRCYIRGVCHWYNGVERAITKHFALNNPHQTNRCRTNSLSSLRAKPRYGRQMLDYI